MQLARGESKTFTFTCTDSNGTAINLSGATATVTVYDLDGATVLSLAGTITNAAAGVFTVSVSAVQSDLEPGARWADAVVVTGAGQTLKVSEHGPFYVTGT
jgi:hypothetical protein